MDTKMVKLAVGKLTDEVEQLKTEMKELRKQVSLKPKKTESETEPQPQLNFQIDDKLLDLMQVRKVLNVSRNSVLSMVKTGRLRAVRINKRTIRYSKAEVQALIKSIA